MGAQQGSGQEVGSEQRNACNLGISRSCLGWLSVRFDGGPSYPEMVATLKQMADQYGYLIRRGEKVSGGEWLQRINEAGARLTECQIRAVRTLMASM